MFGKITSYFLLTITVILCVVALMLSTPWGSQLTIILIDKTTPFRMSYEKGIILENIKLSKLSLEEKELSINATGILFKLTPRCLWQKKICFDELVVDSLSIKALSDKPQKTKRLAEKQIHLIESNDVKKLSFPFAIKANKFNVKRLKVVIDDLSFDGENMNSKTRLENSTLTLSNLDVASLNITLNDDITSNNAMNDNTPWTIASLPKIDLPLDLLIEKANVKKLSLKPINELYLKELNNSQLTFSWHSTELIIQTLETNHVEFGKVSLAGKVNFIPPYQLDITAQSKLNNIDLSPYIYFDNTYDKNQQQFKLSGDLSALTFNGQLMGNIDLVAKGQVNLTHQSLPFSSEIIISKYPELDDFLAAKKSIKAVVTANGDLHKQQIMINGEVNAYGYQTATLSAKANKQENKLIINELTFTDSHTQSELSLNGKINYSDNLSWDIKVASTGITLPVIKYQDVDVSGRLSGNISMSGEKNSQQWATKLHQSQIQGIINNNTINVAGNVELGFNETSEQWQIKPSELTLTAGKAKLEIKGFTDQNWQVFGALSIPALDQLIATASGEFTSTFEITGDISQPNLHFNNQIRQLFWQEVAIRELDFNGNYQPLQSHKLDMQLTSEEIHWQSLLLSSFSGQLKGDIDTQSIQVKWLGELAADLSLTSKWFAGIHQWQSKFIKSEISFKDKHWQPNKNILLNYDHKANTFWVNQHCWLGKSIKLCSEDDLNLSEAGEIKLIADIELKDINDLFIPDDILISAKLHNKVSLKWQPLQPITWSATSVLSEGNIKLLKTKNLKEQPLTIAWQKGNAAIRFEDKVLSSQVFITPQAQINKPEQKKQEKTGLVDINTKIDFAHDKRLSGNIKVDDLSLFFLQAFLSEVSQLTGIINSDIQLSGTLSSPNFYGNLAINNSNISVIRSANKIEDFSLTLELLGKRAQLFAQGMINNDKVNITGKLNWQEAFNGFFDINADKVNLIHPPNISATITPKIHVAMNKEQLTLTGEIDIHKGNVTINKLPEGIVSISNDVVIVSDSGKAVYKDTRFAITTDLKINIADNVKISGYGFDGILGGKLVIKQQPHQDVQLLGNLVISDGLYRAYGQRLSVKNGRVSFNGPANNPLIDLRAIRYLPKENVTAGIEITGAANALSVDLFSTPTKSKSEILSYIIRGRGIDTKAKSNDSLGITLGATLANASGILEQIEKLPLINNVEIEGDDKQASIAGYVGDNLYLKYGVGVTEPVNELTVRLYLLNRLWLETVSGLESSADLYFSFDVN